MSSKSFAIGFGLVSNVLHASRAVSKFAVSSVKSTARGATRSALFVKDGAVSGATCLGRGIADTAGSVTQVAAGMKYAVLTAGMPPVKTPRKARTLKGPAVKINASRKSRK